MRGPGTAGLEARIRRYWAGEPGLSRLVLTGVTAPLASLYGGGVGLRNLAFDSGLLPRREGAIPVVSVGNLAVGGTGKTPVARWVVKLLVEEGFRPALVSRGYGEDELLLHRRWHPGIPVIRAPNRIEGVRAATEQGRDVAVLDDGFQHRWLARELDLVLLSPAHPFPPRLLPRGPYREPLGALRRAHLLLVTSKGKGEEGPGADLVATLRSVPGLPPVHLVSLHPGEWEDLAGGPAAVPEGPVLAVTSVARPESFVALLEETGIPAGDLLAFPDHHPYGQGEVDEIQRRAGGRTVVTTEKDAVKLHAFRNRLPRVRVLPLRVHAEPLAGRAVQAALRKAVGGDGAERDPVSGAQQ
jgi:tetraacyldisaccharide 4'-kinase